MLNELIGKGRTANIYKFDDNKVIKLFNEDVTKESIEYEYTITKIANTFHCQTPKVYEMINDAGGKLYACKASVEMFGLKMVDFVDEVD